MVGVVPGSIKITMPKDLGDGRRPRPNLFVGATNIVCHLTQGFDSTQVPNNVFGSANEGSIDRAIADQAWRAKAEFQLDTDDPKQIDQFEFGFIQIMYAGLFVLSYAGTKRALGSIAIQPNFQNEHYLDSNFVHTPWTMLPADRQIVIGNRVTCFTGDHPAFLTTRVAQNFHPTFATSASIENHFQAIHHGMNFVTILTQFEKKTLKAVPLASFRWRLKYGFEVKYTKSKPFVTNLSALVFDPQATIGPPDLNGDEKRIFERRSGDFFNTVAPPKYRAALQKNSPFRTDSDMWFLSIPKDFYT